MNGNKKQTKQRAQVETLKIVLQMKKTQLLIWKKKAMRNQTLLVVLRLRKIKTWKKKALRNQMLLAVLKLKKAKTRKKKDQRL